MMTARGSPRLSLLKKAVERDRASPPTSSVTKRRRGSPEGNKLAVTLFLWSGLYLLKTKIVKVEKGTLTYNVEMQKIEHSGMQALRKILWTCFVSMIHLNIRVKMDGALKHGIR